MRKTLLVVILFLLGVGLLASEVSHAALPFFNKEVKGNGDLKTVTREVENFNNITTTSNMSVTIKKGEKASVVVKADSNLLPYIVTQVKDKTLTLAFQSKIDVNSDDAVKVLVTLPVIKGLMVSGNSIVTGKNILAKQLDLTSDGNGFVKLSGNIDVKVIKDNGNSAVNITGAKSDGLTIIANGNSLVSVNGKVNLLGLSKSGTGEVTIDGIDSQKLTIQNSGAAILHLSGQAKDLTMQVQGAGVIKSQNLVAENAKVHVLGSGQVSLHVTDHLSAYIAGSGNIVYTGTPKKITKEIFGSGSVNAS